MTFRSFEEEPTRAEKGKGAMRRADLFCDGDDRSWFRKKIDSDGRRLNRREVLTPIIPAKSAVVTPGTTVIGAAEAARSSGTRTTIACRARSSVAARARSARAIVARTSSAGARPSRTLSGPSGTWSTGVPTLAWARPSTIVAKTTSSVRARTTFRLSFIVGIAVARLLTLLQPVGEKLQVRKLGRITHGSVRCSS